MFLYGGGTVKKSFLSLVIASVLLLSPFAVRADIYDQNLEARFIEVKLNEKNNLDYVCSKEAGNEFVFTPKENCGYRLEVLEENEDLYAGIYDAKFNNTIDDPFEGFIGKRSDKIHCSKAPANVADPKRKGIRNTVAYQGRCYQRIGKAGRYYIRSCSSVPVQYRPCQNKT